MKDIEIMDIDNTLENEIAEIEDKAPEENKKKKKSSGNLGTKIVAWLMLIAMVASVFTMVISAIFAK